MGDKADSEKQPLTSQAVHHEQTWVMRHIGLVAILWGYVTLTVIWAAAVTLLQGKFKDAPQYAQYYLLTVGIIVTFFEMTWLLDKLACCVRQGLCCKVWAVILWVDKWRKFILYTGLSVPLFLEGIRVLISVMSGFCLLVLACLYLVKSFSNMRRVRDEHAAEPRSASPVVRHEMGTQTSNATNPFEEEEWSEEDTPYQRRQREQEQERRRQQRQEELRRQEEQRRHEEEKRHEEQRRQEEKRRQEDLKREEELRQQEQRRRDDEKSSGEQHDIDSREKSGDTTGSDNQ